LILKKIDFFNEYNIDNNLRGSLKISPHNLILNRKNKGWLITNVVRPYYNEK